MLGLDAPSADLGTYIEYLQKCQTVILTVDTHLSEKRILLRQGRKVYLQALGHDIITYDNCRHYWFWA